jgi:glycerophosphoryl diester phosphodiesterase
MSVSLLAVASLAAFASFTPNPTQCVAHRGLHVNELENSMRAIVAAVDIGAGGVEFDVQHTSDGVGIIQHDATLLRMGKSRLGHVCKLTAKISSQSYQQISQNCVLRNDDEIPTLREVVSYLSEQDVLSFVEAKDALSSDSIDAIADAYSSKPDRLVLISFKGQLLQNIIGSKLGNIIRRGARIVHLATTFNRFDQTYPGAGIDHPTAEHIAHLRADNKSIDAWTIDSPNEIDFYIDQHVNYLTTNDPALCLQKALAVAP